MNKINSFQTKVTLIFIFSILFIIGLGNFLLYEYSLKLQFNQIKYQLMTVSRTAALAVDSQTLMKIPLNHEGINSPEYKAITDKLIQIKQANPSLKYIYILTKTGQPGILQFVADPDPVGNRISAKRPTAFPGDKYDASVLPEMLNAFNASTVENKLTVDEWGVTLSGYAPIRDSHGQAVAILGADINAENIYLMQKMLRLRILFVLLIGFFVSIIVGIFISRRVTKPIEKLLEGTRRIANGDLQYKVDIPGKDEIAELASSFNNMADSLAVSRRKIEEYFYRVVQAMIRSLEAKDHYTRGHSDRVGDYAERIALEMGLGGQKAAMLKEAAQLHDIGKLGIHEDILNKKEQLSPDEWDVLHKHPQVGEDILKPIFFEDYDFLSVVRSHHERYDGTGYPDGLKGNEISLSAQIIAVADSYDAMTSSRAYRAALSKEEGISRLKQGSGTQFNPKIVEAFIRTLE